MSQGVLYWSVGERHAEHFIVTILSLRDHYDGPVAVVVGDEDADRLAKAVQEPMGPLEIIPFDYKTPRRKHGRHTTYLAKTWLWKHTPFDKTIFLDLDTLVVGDISALWPKEEQVVLTQFCKWETTGKMIGGRIEKWRGILPQEVAQMRSQSYPAINTGVMAWDRRTKAFMERWQLETAKQPIFMCDELVAQLIFPWYFHNIFDHRWNCSPKHSEEYLPPNSAEDVKIWHGHGYKFHKSKHGPKIWGPYYERAKEMNLGGIRDWTPTKKFKPYWG